MKGLLIYFLMSLSTLSAFTQSISAEGLINEISDTLKAMDNIRYEVVLTRAADTAKATVYQQRAEVEDVGFGKLMLKLEGNLISAGDTMSFRFLRDSLSFTIQERGMTPIVIVNPTKNEVLELLSEAQQYLILPEFTSVQGMDGYLEEDYTRLLRGWSQVNGSDTQWMTFIRSYSSPSTGRVSRLMYDWYIDEKSLLPRRIKYPNKFMLDLNILEVNAAETPPEFKKSKAEKSKQRKKKK